MPQASTTHADFVRTRTVLSLSFLKPQRQTLYGRALKDTNGPGKERT
jgi:hypothetical protein